MTTSPTQVALLAALKAIMAECGRVPGQRPHDLDSYLPAHLLDAAQAAIDAAEAKALAAENRLKAEFAEHGYELNHFSYYLADGYGRAHHLPTRADAEAFLVELKGGAR